MTDTKKVNLSKVNNAKTRAMNLTQRRRQALKAYVTALKRLLDSVYRKENDISLGTARKQVAFLRRQIATTIKAIRTA